MTERNCKRFNIFIGNSHFKTIKTPTIIRQWGLRFEIWNLRFTPSVVSILFFSVIECRVTRRIEITKKITQPPVYCNRSSLHRRDRFCCFLFFSAFSFGKQVGIVFTHGIDDIQWLVIQIGIGCLCHNQHIFYQGIVLKL